MRAISLGALIGALWFGVADADLTPLDGKGPPFAFTAGGKGFGGDKTLDWVVGLRPRDTLTIVLAVAGRYRDDPNVTFHLSIPAGLKLLSGDTTKAGRLSAIRGNYTLRLLMRTLGEHQISGRIHISGLEQIDDAAFVMPITVIP
jgi:hypothetical protein